NDQAQQPSVATAPFEVRILRGQAIDSWLQQHPSWSDHPARDHRWLQITRDGLGHEPLLLEAVSEGRTVGVLPLALVQSFLFGRFLVSLPYVNSAGLVARDDSVVRKLIDRAVELADENNVRYLELRQEQEVQ